MKYKVDIGLKYLTGSQKVRMESMHSVLHSYIFQEMVKSTNSQSSLAKSSLSVVIPEL